MQCVNVKRSLSVSFVGFVHGVSQHLEPEAQICVSLERLENNLIFQKKTYEDIYSENKVFFNLSYDA